MVQLGRLIFCAISVVLCIATLLIGASFSSATEAVGAADASVTNCASCHAKQTEDWQASHHFHAMADIASPTNLGNFNNVELSFENGPAKFQTVNGEYFITFPGENNAPVQHRVTHTFGYQPLQQFMFEQVPGTFQFFPYAWDSRPQTEGGQRWFVLHPEQQPFDEFHWQQSGQNWNLMCADCHSTNFAKGYKATTDQYQSHYDSINVGCAACHGDSAAHLRWAGGDQSVADKGYSTYIGSRTPLFREDDKGLMASIAAIKPSEQVPVCASCHSRRSQWGDRGAPHEYFEHFQPSLITVGLYHADGQILEEDYVWGSFVQSKMHEAGVTCTNCHNPHSGQLKLPGNQVCTQCHTVEKYDTKDHHGHPLTMAGSQCVDCHMPATTYMQVDPRRDHSFQLPRPDLTQSIGVPNACNGCHTDQTPEWAEQAIRTWHPDSSTMGSEHFASAFAAADAGESGADSALTKIAQDSRYPDIIRASALARMGSTPGQNAVVAIVRAVRDTEPLKRQGAITAAAPYPVTERWRMLNALLDDTHAPIRTEAARSLVGMLNQPPQSALSEPDQQRLSKAVAEYRELQSYQSDRGFSHANLGNLAQELGRIKEAENHYRQAIAVEPIFMPAYVNLADIYRVRGRESEVVSILREALAINPEAGAVYYALAMSLVRQGDKIEALKALQKAALYSQGNASFIYTYGLLLQDQQKGQEALGQFLKAYQLTPNNPDISYSLALQYRTMGRYQQALHYARKLGTLVPDNPQIVQLIQSIEAQIK